MFTISQTARKRNLNLLNFIALAFAISLTISLGISPDIALGKDVFGMNNPSGNKITLRLSLSRAEHSKGLSGVKTQDFSQKEGMLFVNPEMAPRRFWMPDTHFNLDIVFLDSALKVVAVEKNVPAHPGTVEPPLIYKTGTYIAQFVLETKAGAPFTKHLKKDDVLKFTGPISLSEIVSKTRQLR